MTRRIFKHTLSLIGGAQDVQLPKGAKIVHVNNQYELPTIWAEVDPEAESVRRRFAVVGTGHPVPDGGEYRGTVITTGGGLVWHVYELI